MTEPRPDMPDDEFDDAVRRLPPDRMFPAMAGARGASPRSPLDPEAMALLAGKRARERRLAFMRVGADPDADHAAAVAELRERQAKSWPLVRDALWQWRLLLAWLRSPRRG